MEQILNTKKATVIADRYFNELSHAMSGNDIFTISRLVDFYRAISGLCEIGRLPEDVDDYGLCARVAHNIHNKCASLLEDGYEQLLVFRKGLEKEDKVDVFVKEECKWYNAKIIDLRFHTNAEGDEEKEIFVKFRGWPDKYNVWISVLDSTASVSPPDSKTNKKHSLWVPWFLRQQEQEQREREEKEKAEKEMELMEDETSNETPIVHSDEMEEKYSLSRSGYRTIISEKSLNQSASIHSSSSTLASSPSTTTNGSTSNGMANITTCVAIDRSISDNSSNSHRGRSGKTGRGRTFGGTNQITEDTTVVEGAEAEDDNDWVCAICGLLEHETDPLSALALCDGPCMRSFHVACLGFVGRPTGKTWYCNECKADAHSCFVCGLVGQDYLEVTKCQVELCGKYYHETCLTALPDQGFCNVEIKKTKGSRPAAITSRERNAGSESSPVKNSKNLDDIELLQFKCPYHTCWTCSEWHDAQPSNYRKKVKGGGFKNTELFKCIACPKAFHMKCIPPASRHNSMCLLCPDHPQRLLPTKDNSSKSFQNSAVIFSYYTSFEEGCLPDVDDITASHYKLPIHLREDVKAEAQPAEFRKIRSLDYSTLPGGIKATPYRSNGEQKCICVDVCDENCWNRISKIECCGKASTGNDKIKRDRMSNEDGSTAVGLNNCNVGPDCGNRSIAKRQYSKIVKFREHAMGWGAKAGHAISEGDLVVEYVGEVIDEAEMSRRMIHQRTYTPNDGDFYVMELDSGIYVDGKHVGSDSRFINHSCDPNCELERWVVNGRSRIGIFAIKDIEKDEPLSYDYQFDTQESSTFKCFCGAAKCRGTMAPSDKNDKTSEQLSERERKALIKQGQLRESDSKSNRTEEINRSYVSTHLPGDNVQEIKKGPYIPSVKQGGQYGVLLGRNVNRVGCLGGNGWGRRRGYGWVTAGSGNGKHSINASILDMSLVGGQPRATSRGVDSQSNGTKHTKKARKRSGSDSSSDFENAYIPVKSKSRSK